MSSSLSGFQEILQLESDWQQLRLALTCVWGQGLTCHPPLSPRTSPRHCGHAPAAQEDLEPTSLRTQTDRGCLMSSGFTHDSIEAKRWPSDSMLLRGSASRESDITLRRRQANCLLVAALPLLLGDVQTQLQYMRSGGIASPCCRGFDKTSVHIAPPKRHRKHESC